MTHGYADPDGLDEASRRALEIGADVLGALHVVLHRLASRTSDSPTCTSTAQELAFRALVNTAGLFLDEDADVDDLRDFYEDHVEDTDVELLFDQALDGLEEPSHPRTTPPVNLEFDRWFDPFGGAWPAATGPAP